MNWRGLFNFSQLTRLFHTQIHLCQHVSVPSSWTGLPEQFPWPVQHCQTPAGISLLRASSIIPRHPCSVPPLLSHLQSHPELSRWLKRGLPAWWHLSHSEHWLFSAQEDSPADIISTLEGAITFCSLLAKLSLTVHPTCPAVPTRWDLLKFSTPFYHRSLVSFLVGPRWNAPQSLSPIPHIASWVQVCLRIQLLTPGLPGSLGP